MTFIRSLDFSSKNLQGCDFRGQNLTDTNFSHSDIRGANFTGANLTRANFSHAKAGLQKFWVISIVIAVLLEHLILVGFVPTVATHKVGLVTNSSYISHITVSFILLLVFFATVTKGLRAGLLTLFVPAILTLLVMGFEALAGATETFLSIDTILPVLVAWLAVVFIATHITWITKLAGIFLGSLVLIAYVIGSLAGIIWVNGWNLTDLNNDIIWHIAEMLLSGYIYWRTVIGDEKFALLDKIAISLAAIGGTNFRETNLTDADFTGATLKNTDLRNAKLIRTNFHWVRKLNNARVEKTILVDSKIRDLLVTKKGTKKSFIGCNLKGANIAGADLSYAELTEADISGATFEGATLEGANLTKTQAIAADFQQAKLTGACLEAWNIDSTTNIEGVSCDYIYLLNNQQERRPSSGKFTYGEFTKLFQVAINTVDLIFRNGLDLQALSAALAKVKVENEGIQLAIKSVENKGDGVVVVRVDVPDSADKVRIHADFTQNYETFLKALEAKYQIEIKSKDEQIAIYRKYEEDLKELIKMLAPTPRKSPEGKLVVLKLGEGDLSTGFPVTLQIGLEGDRPFFESHGKLPPAAELAVAYTQWQDAYRRSLRGILRLNIPNTQVTNVSRSDLYEECNTLAEYLQQNINFWLNSQTFRPIKEQLLEKLTPLESIRIVLQTEDSQLRRLPFQLWDFFERYPQAEIALSSSIYEKLEKSLSPNPRMRILAILGDSTGINVLKDRVLLEQLFNTEVTFLVEPQRQELNDELWQQPWDILFFAGHSLTEADREVGKIHINKNDTLTISELRNAISKAIKQGLQLAIFNSCDGLGLAVNLADLHLPQIIVMREPVPDYVATEFLKNFLTEFSSGKSLYQSVREARSKLQGLEDKFPCATWLPVIYQNPAEIPLMWYQ